MKLLLKRKFLGETYTIGDLFINGVFFCNTIEDKVRDLPAECPNTPKGINCKCEDKVYSETAIPYGTYKVTVKRSPRFKRLLPYLHDVPHFLGILMHNGNTAENSAGCVILGKNKIKGKVLESKVTLGKLMDKLKGETSIDIEIV